MQGFFIKIIFYYKIPVQIKNKIRNPETNRTSRCDDSYIVSSLLSFRNWAKYEILVGNKIFINVERLVGRRSEERKVLGSAAGDEECTDDVSSGAGAASPASPRDDEQPAATHLWPSMQDLNTRLRRLITAYQRNYKREELKMQQRAKVRLSFRLFTSR